MAESDKSKKGCFRLPGASKTILRSWFEKNKYYPYPSEADIQSLSTDAHITPTQVRTWFSNERYRQDRKKSHSEVSKGEDSEESSHRDTKCPSTPVLRIGNDEISISHGSYQQDIVMYPNGLERSTPQSSYPNSITSRASSAFSHCSDAVWAGPRRKGRKLFTENIPDAWKNMVGTKRSLSPKPHGLSLEAKESSSSERKCTFYAPREGN
jgi:homeobox KN domain-containing protein